MEDKQLEKRSVRHLVILSLLVSMCAIFGYLLSIENQLIKISFVFIPKAMIGTLYSPLLSSIGVGLADFLGMILFGKAPYFIGFSINSCISGAIYGAILTKECSLKNIVFATVLNSVLISLLLTPLWLAFLYNVPLYSYALWSARLIKCFFDIPIQIFLLNLVLQSPTIRKMIEKR